jgi:putative ABC transport system ATP-binding protein
MIQTSAVTFSYDGIRQMSFPDIQCSSGEQCLILGPSGSGKTTLLHVMAGILKPKGGQVTISGKDLYALSSGNQRHFRSNEIGLVFQVPHFIAALSMEDNMMLTQKLAGRKRNPQEIKDYFNELEIGHRIHALPAELSQGELQRASLIRAVINRPSVILADEPTSALDDQNAEKVVNLLKTFSVQNGAALIIVTHDRRIKEAIGKTIILEA